MWGARGCVAGVDRARETVVLASPVYVCSILFGETRVFRTRGVKVCIGVSMFEGGPRSRCRR